MSYIINDIRVPTTEGMVTMDASSLAAYVKELIARIKKELGYFDPGSAGHTLIVEVPFFEDSEVFRSLSKDSKGAFPVCEQVSTRHDHVHVEGSQEPTMIERIVEIFNKLVEMVRSTISQSPVASRFNLAQTSVSIRRERTTWVLNAHLARA